VTEGTSSANPEAADGGTVASDMEGAFAMTLGPPRTFRRGHSLFLMVVAGFLIYAALFIYRTSFVIDGVRYFSLFDDAMVSMRYARNLAHGFGLVWNPGGERIEGYTNPLWVLFMSLVHLLPISQIKTSLVVQIAAAGFLVLNLYVVRRIALAVTDGIEAAALGAVVLTASYLPINNWSLQGMEVGVLVLIMSIALWWALACMRDGRLSLPLYLLLGVSTWIRPDMVVPFGAVMLFLAAVDPRNRRGHLLWGSLILLAFCAAQTAFRSWYFGDVLPNTYYLKLTGYPLMLRLSRGAYVLAEFIWSANILLFAIPFALAFKRDRRILLLLWVFTIQMLYSVYVGGDAWEYWGGSNRYICIAMPGFFVVLSYGLLRLSRLIIGAVMAGPRRAGTPTAMRTLGVFSLLVVLSMLSFNSIYGPKALAEALLIKPPLHTGNGGENQLEVEEALRLREVTAPDATIVVVRAGTIPYFADRPSIDLLGKTDRHIAHEPMRPSSPGLRRFVEFRPGHMKYDYGYSIEGEKPDVVVQLWRHPEEVQPYLRAYYRSARLQGMCLYFRKGSPLVSWEKLPAESCD
jgi:arabinofuranosyltransferase